MTTTAARVEARTAEVLVPRWAGFLAGHHERLQPA